MMRSLSRIASLAVLLSTLWVVHPGIQFTPDTPEYPLRQPVDPDAIRQRGAIRFSVSADSIRRFQAPEEPWDFDYELLARFASELGVELVRIEVPTDQDAVGVVRSGRADFAVLPASFRRLGQEIPARACPGPERSGEETRLDAFVSSDSPKLASLLDGAARHVADFSLDETVFRSYCKSAWRAPMGVAVPFGRRVARYADVIARSAEGSGLDWRLVAAVISEESSFEENAISSAGAQGLMQLMPAISGAGMATILSPESNIRAGIRYLSQLTDRFPDAQPADRLAMVLASYLVGPGHVDDAQDLTRSLGLNSQSWRRGLEETLPLLEDPRFFQRTRLGFARGRRAVTYVNRILERYEIYRTYLTPDLGA
jgi:membrane-bound lytic murein transglycosylase MltF